LKDFIILTKKPTENVPSRAFSCRSKKLPRMIMTCQLTSTRKQNMFLLNIRPQTRLWRKSKKGIIKRNNHIISKQRIYIEHAIMFVKRFHILSERYRNRRKRFALRFSLIADIYNFDMSI
jgi:hypothetical protein